MEMNLWEDFLLVGSAKQLIGVEVAKIEWLSLRTQYMNFSLGKMAFEWIHQIRFQCWAFRRWYTRTYTSSTEKSMWVWVDLHETSRNSQSFFHVLSCGWMYECRKRSLQCSNTGDRLSVSFAMLNVFRMQWFWIQQWDPLFRIILASLCTHSQVNKTNRMMLNQFYSRKSSSLFECRNRTMRSKPHFHTKCLLRHRVLSCPGSLRWAHLLRSVRCLKNAFIE